MTTGVGGEATPETTIQALELQIEELKNELTVLQKEKSREEKEDDDDDRKLTTSLSKDNNLLVTIPEKKGYLFQWQDRSIGWGGTKWSLLFVSLERGRLECSLNHLDHNNKSPISVLTLRDCAVQDEGVKRDRRYKNHYGKDPPIDTPGAYFHVFAIFHRPDSDLDDDEDNDNNSDEHEFSASALPLLRFSTTTLADKMQWMELISQTCAYCATDEFMAHEAARVAEATRQEEEQAKMALAMPGASKGTLPPLYFAPATTHPGGHGKSHTKAQRRPSKGMKKSSSFRSMSKTQDADKKEARYPPSKPMHTTAAPSFLSSEAPVQNYRGLFNLAMILLIVSNFRLILDTIRLNGLAIWHVGEYVERLSQNYAEDPWHDFPFVSGFLLLQGFMVATFVIEWLLSRDKLSETFGMALHGVNMHSTLLVSMSIVWYQIDKPAVGAVLLLHSIITWMKLISYVCANEDYRLTLRTGDGKKSMEASLALLSNLEQEDLDISYPQNISLANLYYFWFAPTLTYQIAFPRTPRVRVRRVVGIFLGLIACVALFSFLVAQIVTPTLNSLVLDLEKTGGVYTPGIMADYWLRLAIANTYLWLLMFYAYFHLYLNLWAEVLRFGDRVFYKDWWNSSEIGSYWRLWNMPVHLWLVRHLYFPAIRMNVSKTVAMLIVFTVSAILHEILVSVPFHIVTVPWSFIGMMMQVPLVAVTKFLQGRSPGSSVGNIIFWLTFCVIGQPMAILMYTADYQYAKHHAELREISLE